MITPRPTSSSSHVLIIQSIITENSSGDNRNPCLTPDVTLNQSKRFPFMFTAHSEFLYKFLIASMSCMVWKTLEGGWFSVVGGQLVMWSVVYVLHFYWSVVGVLISIWSVVCGRWLIGLTYSKKPFFPFFLIL